MSKSWECTLALWRAAVSCKGGSRRFGPSLQTRSLSQAVRSGARERDDATNPPIMPSKSREEWRRQDVALAQHLHAVFSPLEYPPELASRILTHASHPDAIRRHNARLSFVGRRVLQSYLLMFIHSSPALKTDHDYEKIMERTLNTYALGEHVAPQWALGKVLKWRPMNVGYLSKPLGLDVDVPTPLVAPGKENARSIGMYKVHGTTVEAVMGGTFHQFGGAVAHRLFHTRLLPHLCIEGSPDGLHAGYHEHALDICDKMGGLTGPLLR